MPRSQFHCAVRAALSLLLASSVCLAGLTLAWWVADAPDVYAGGTPASGTVADELITVTGSQSDTADGDWISAFTDPGGDGLDTFHSFFIEVPTGASRLVVDLFDMDILFGLEGSYMTGVDPAEQLAERDRIRAYSIYLDDTVGNFSNRISYTFATYQLIDPSGTTVVTRRIHGSHFAPSDGDNAWLTFYDSDTTFDSGTFDTWADDFSGGTYSENDGTQSFTTDWIESQETGVNSSAGPGAGLLRVLSNQLQIRDLGDFSPDTGREPGIERELDLTGYVAARMSFDYTVSNDIEDDDCIVIEMSSDGGGTWTAIDDFSGEELTYSGTLQYDISEFISSQTRVRFRVENLFAGSAEDVRIDNFEIRAQTAAPAAPDAGHWELRVDVSTGALRAATVAASRNGDETNAFGFRAHDGDATSGGAEYNAYTYTYTAGINPNDSGRDYNLYPYITRDCEFDVSDFDWDSDLPNNPGGPAAPFGTLDVVSPDTTFTSAQTLSPNNMWTTTTATTFTDNDTASQYGLWSMPFRVEDPNDGNYAPIYLADGDDAGAPLLSPLPDPDTYRIYLPSDGDGVPAKPYMQQFLAKAIIADPDPPGPGETTRYAVTVRLVNPSGSIGDINFDGATRTVTTRFPGGMASYEGVAILDQGTIVSEPALGSTTPGDIVWNPGTLSAGSGGTDEVARLVYFFDVMGAAPPYSLNAAEVPGTGNGTRATWSDETGEDFTFGELCQMTISSPVPPTPAVISEVSGTWKDGLPTLRFETASEAETLAFTLERWDAERRPYKNSDINKDPSEGEAWTPLESGPVGALLDQPQGGVYYVADPSATGDRSTYRIRELTSSGREQVHGPFRVTFEQRDASSENHWLAAQPFARAPHAPSAAHAARQRRAKLEEGVVVVEDPQAASLRLKVAVEHTGIQRLELAALAAAFGVSEAEISGDLVTGGFDLTLGSDDQTTRIGWTLSPDRGALEFYGEAVDSPYTGTNIYWLERAPGLVMRRTPTRRVPPDWSGESFTESLRLERNTRPVVILELDPESDNWFWELVRSGDPAQAFELDIPDPTGLGEASLSLHLQGASDGEHRLDVHLGGTYIGEAQVSGRQATTAQIGIDPALLVDGLQTVSLTGTSGNLVAVDAFTVDYERLSHAAQDRLAMPPSGQQVATASGFSRADIRVYDLANPQRPNKLTPRVLSEGSGFRALWVQDSRSGPYYLATGDGVFSPQILPDLASDLRSSANSADYLLIAPPSLTAAADGLADWRQGQGLESMVVSLEDIYDEFAAGLADPRAIRDFLQTAATEWKTAPRYAVLIGHGTYDFRDWYGLGGNLLPPLLWSRDGTSLFPTDAHYADADADGAPSIAIGRLPVMGKAELLEQIDKIIAYESLGEANWLAQIALTAGAVDSAGDFVSDMASLDSLVPPGFTRTDIALDQLPSLEDARLLLQTTLDMGTAHLHYVGHGGFDRLSRSGLLTSADVAALNNQGRPGILTAASCTLGLHALPGLDSLAELLVLRPTGGSIAAFAPAWLSDNQPASLLTDRLFRELYDDDGDKRLGDAVRQALESAAAIGTSVDLLYTYQLIGDPALRLQLMPEPLPPGCIEDCGSG